ncbi:unknown protein [Microcystis aeruginosa NIES-843]|uniref:Uncharacterized protein n=1 Tax=Microcystis aeruginosa (strain NIES-843 / IAM M-2473) TaxID=449447 RepID=B0JN35_MICAN|nr:unknown protein [Microcystis aeruginosa NIES-843]
MAACCRSIFTFSDCPNMAYKTPRLRIIVIIAIIVDWVDPRKPNKKIQTDLGVGCWVSTVGWVEARNPTIHPRKPNKKIQTDLGFGCWVSLFLRIERFSLTYLFAQTNLRNY